ncbi:MAG: hypothetical protein AAFN11_00635 [Chloroflexota bacterium]
MAIVIGLQGMLNEIFRHWRYFIPSFARYGVILGALFGALTYPILGLLVGAPWGLAAGLVLGILSGIGVPLYNRYAAPSDDDAYQTQLTYGMGFLTLITMALPMLFIYALPAGLVAAFLGHEYAENRHHINIKRKNDKHDYQHFSRATTAMLSRGKYVVILGVAMGLLAFIGIGVSDPFINVSVGSILGVGIVSTIYGTIVASVIAVVNAIFIVFANRLFFADMPKEQYKPRLMGVVGILTLFLSMIVTAGIGAPIAAIAGALGAGKYADWRYSQATQAEDIATRKAHLEDDLSESDSLADVDYVTSDNKHFLVG